MYIGVVFCELLISLYKAQIPLDTLFSCGILTLKDLCARDLLCHSFDRHVVWLVSKCVEDYLCQIVSYPNCTFLLFYIFQACTLGAQNPKKILNKNMQSIKLVQTLTIASSSTMLLEALHVTSCLGATPPDKACYVERAKWNLAVIDDANSSCADSAVVSCCFVQRVVYSLWCNLILCACHSKP